MTTQEDVLRGLVLDRFSEGYRFGAGAISAGVAVTVSETEVDPFDVLYGRCNSDPFWEEFPRWLNEYRHRTNNRFLPPED